MSESGSICSPFLPFWQDPKCECEFLWFYLLYVTWYKEGIPGKSLNFEFRLLNSFFSLCPSWPTTQLFPSLASPHTAPLFPGPLPRSCPDLIELRESTVWNLWERGGGSGSGESETPTPNISRAHMHAPRYFWSVLGWYGYSYTISNISISVLASACLWCIIIIMHFCSSPCCQNKGWCDVYNLQFCMRLPPVWRTWAWIMNVDTEF
jgi:hypothetical protein